MKRKEGFKGQRSIVVPEYILEEMAGHPHHSLLHLTDIGYFPNAADHYRSRPNGCSQYILMYCVSGSGWISVDSKKHEVKANQYFIIPAGKPHSYGSNATNPWTIYWIHYTGTQAPHYSFSQEEVRNITPSHTDRIDDRLTLFEEMMQNLEMGYSMDNLSYVNVCLIHFLASFVYLAQYRHIRSIKAPDTVEQSIHFMKNKLHTKLNLEVLAREAGLSASHYALMFKQKTGRAPVDYLIQLRVQKACQLLDHSALRIKEIAMQVGYDDAYYFSRIFKKLMNLSPRDYRMKSKG